MKKFILPLILALIASPALAKPAKTYVTPIQFAKGSECGSFDGSLANREFTLHLKKNQWIRIGIESSKPITEIVKDPKGKTLKHDDGDEWGVIYDIKQTGKYHIAFELEDKAYPFAEVKICAYDK
ncbi:hypothetical protein L3D26_04220 [Moraxella sp. ZY21109]|uniref:hypothetical protein n=1 Tax=Moraxella sp. ZY21109 TaxID=2911969 RepID=UPI003D7EE8C9